MPETVTALMEVNARAATRVDAGAKFTLVATVTGGPPDNKLLGGEVCMVYCVCGCVRGCAHALLAPINASVRL